MIAFYVAVGLASLLIGAISKFLNGVPDFRYGTAFLVPADARSVVPFPALAQF